MKLIVGLGNPGANYAHNRHNLGFMVIQAVATKYQLPAWSTTGKAQASICKGKIGDQEVVLAKPQTFMNLSGEAVQALASFYKLDPAEIWVIHDELDLPFGNIRIRNSGDSAGHNGVGSIIQALGTRDFVRFRLGIANATLHNPIPAEAFVLQNFAPDEQASLDQILERAVTTVTDSLPDNLTHRNLTLL